MCLTLAQENISETLQLEGWCITSLPIYNHSVPRAIRFISFMNDFLALATVSNKPLTCYYWWTFFPLLRLSCYHGTAFIVCLSVCMYVCWSIYLFNYYLLFSSDCLIACILLNIPLEDFSVIWDINMMYRWIAAPGAYILGQTFIS